MDANINGWLLYVACWIIQGGVVEKADLSSNPYIDHFPTSPIHLTQDSNFVKRLVEYNIVK